MKQTVRTVQKKKGSAVECVERLGCPRAPLATWPTHAIHRLLTLPVSHTFPNPPLFRIFPAQLERQETAAGFQ